MPSGRDYRTFSRTSLEWAGGTICVVLVWMTFATQVMVEISWLPVRIVHALRLDPAQIALGMKIAEGVQLFVAILAMAVMVMLSVLVGGWFRRLIAEVRDAGSLRMVVLSLFAPLVAGLLIAAVEPLKRSFMDWPTAHNPFPGYMAVWALTLGYMMKLPWDCATELLREEALWSRIERAGGPGRRRNPPSSSSPRSGIDVAVVAPSRDPDER